MHKPRIFKYTVGETYETQEGKMVTVIGRHVSYRGYETLICNDGCARYDRCFPNNRDAGRVTGTDHDYSDPRNFKR